MWCSWPGQFDLRSLTTMVALTLCERLSGSLGCGLMAAGGGMRRYTTLQWIIIFLLTIAPYPFVSPLLNVLIALRKGDLK